MLRLKPIVFTRPYPIGIGDYTFFERPDTFAKDHEFDTHIRNVLHEDDSGSIGSIVGRRWHVWRYKDFVIVGMATTEFQRKDEGNRSIRGYYGFAIPVSSDEVKLPSEELFKKLDAVCVEPVFQQAPVKTRDSEYLSGMLFEDPTMYESVVDSRVWDFNVQPSRIRFHACADVHELLLSALAFASRNPAFEIVIGLNTEEHAKRLPIMNCVCHAVKELKEIDAPPRPVSDPEKPKAGPRLPGGVGGPGLGGGHSQGGVDTGTSPNGTSDGHEVSPLVFPIRKRLVIDMDGHCRVSQVLVNGIVSVLKTCGWHIESITVEDQLPSPSITPKINRKPCNRSVLTQGFGKSQ